MSRWIRFANSVVVPFGGGLHNLEGKPLLQSFRRRRPLHRARWFDCPGLLRDPVGPLERQLPAVVFLPSLYFHHFGHLLTETAAWLSPLLRRKPWPNQPRDLLLGCWTDEAVSSLAEILDWDRDRIHRTQMLQGPIGIAEDWVPVPTMVNRDCVRPSLSRSVRRLLRRLYGSHVQDFTHSSTVEELRRAVSPKTRLYISRSRLPEGLRRIEREAELDQLLLDRGWSVIYPEQLPVNEQLRQLRQAQVIAGPLGSAFHLLFAFGALPRGPLLLTLGFPDELTADGPGLNFGLQFRYQQMVVEHFPLLALQDSALDPRQASRHLPLRFVIEPEEVAQRLEHHAAAFLADLPQ